MARIDTGIPYTSKYEDILDSVIGQMSDGIWENTRSMEKYWKSLSFERSPQGTIVIIDRDYICENPAEFMANKIKQIIKIEIKDEEERGRSNLRWDRSCSAHPFYMHGNVTVGDCYQLYELLKGRQTSSRSYSTMNTYTVEMNYQGTVIHMQVEATSTAEAKSIALKTFANNARINVDLA